MQSGSLRNAAPGARDAFSSRGGLRPTICIPEGAILPAVLLLNTFLVSFSGPVPSLEEGEKPPSPEGLQGPTLHRSEVSTFLCSAQSPLRAPRQVGEPRVPGGPRQKDVNSSVSIHPLVSPFLSCPLHPPAPFMDQAPMDG